MTKYQKQAQDILKKGVCFKNGHYKVAVLWKDPKISLKNNKEIALQRLDSLGKRLIKLPIKQSII